MSNTSPMGRLQMVALTDMIVIVPGISGSVLEKDGKPCWAFSMAGLWELARSWGGSLKSLALTEDPRSRKDLEDGIKATALISCPSLIAGFYKTDGYTKLLKRIAQFFEITMIDMPSSNLLTFPYDWRRDNRVSADKLQTFINTYLPAWRAASSNPKAKVVFIAHSMGGLVARYYLEVLGGWEDCRALLTLGTPFLGSPQAIGYLSNGYHLGGFDLTSIMRSFTSMYQLLPTYPCISKSGTVSKVHEINNIPGIDNNKALDASNFHKEIEDAVSTNNNIIRYQKEKYVLQPIIGVHQLTTQLADISTGNMQMLNTITLGGTTISDGDGTVPRVSAMPKDIRKEYRGAYFAEKHAYLQSNNDLHTNILAILEDMQTDTSAFRGAKIDASTSTDKMPALSLILNDAFSEGDVITLSVQLINIDNKYHPVARIVNTNIPNETRTYNFTKAEDKWSLAISGLQCGVYNVQVDLGSEGPGMPRPIHDFFEVCAREQLYS